MQPSTPSGEQGFSSPRPPPASRAPPQSPMRSPRGQLGGPSSPGPKTLGSPQKPGLPGKQGRASFAADQLSTMSTAFGGTASEDSSFQSPKRFGRMQRGGGSASPGQRGWNPITGLPTSSSSRSDGGSQPNMSSPRGWENSPAKQYASVRSLHSKADGDLDAKREMRTDLAWSKNGGHYGRMPCNFDKGVTRVGGREATLAGSGCMIPQIGEATPEDAQFTRSVADIHRTQELGGFDVKAAMQSPTVRGESELNRLNPVEFSSGAGANSRDCTTNFVPKCWRPPSQHLTIDNTSEQGKAEVSGLEPTVIASAGAGSWSKRSIQCKQDSSQLRANMDWEHNTQDDGQEVMENYLRFFYGRSMKLGRGVSEPPRPRDRANKKGAVAAAHWAKDESKGAIVPCLSADITRLSESHASFQFQRKAEGAFSKGTSSFNNKLSMKANEGNFRIEQADKTLSERAASVPALRSGRNPVLGEGCDSEPSQIGRYPRAASPTSSCGFLDSPAGMTTRHLATGASVSTSIVALDKPQSGIRGRKPEHGETPMMTALLENSTARDGDRMRMYREAYDKPFVDLCSAFQQIRESQVKDTNRIRAQVNTQKSNNVAELLGNFSSPRAMIEPEGDMIQRGMPRSQESFRSPRNSNASSLSGAAGTSARARSPAHKHTTNSMSQNSLNIGDALKWVC